jgi:hypothetical protein
LNSNLLKSRIGNDTQTITGLDTWTKYTPGNDFFYLEITIDPSTGVNAATMKNWTAGGLWKGGNLPGQTGSGIGPFEYTYVGGVYYQQTCARIPVWQSSNSGSGVVNTQLLSNNLLMTGDTYNGALNTTADGPATIAILMPVPYTAPVTTS